MTVMLLLSQWLSTETVAAKDVGDDPVCAEPWDHHLCDRVPAVVSRVAGPRSTSAGAR